MTTDELRAASGELVTLHQRFAPLFGRTEARAHSLEYLRGLLSPLRRKSAEPMALALTDDLTQADAPVVPLQRFLTRSPWQASAVQQQIQAVFAEQLVPTTATWTLGTVGVLDASDFVKQGCHSVGVAPQYSGRLGKEANCQVGVFLVGVTPGGCALLDHQLYLPKRWSRARRLRRQTRVPVGTRFRTKPTLAAELVQRTVAGGHVRFDWLVADEDYGKDHVLLETLEARQQRYVFEVPSTTLVWRTDPAQAVVSDVGRRRRRQAAGRDQVLAVKELAARLPAEAWQALQMRDGAKGPLVFQFAAVRVWAVRHRKPGPPVWLLLRRSLEQEPEVKYYLSNANEQTPLAQLAGAVCCRWRVDEWFEDSKGYLGLGQYEARSWTSWHHHMSLVALAHLYVTLVRQRLKKKRRS
jgi:SRSO17 transposase